jgi:hypothetical protein
MDNVKPDATSYATKDSGNRQTFSTGARRDTEDDKPKFDHLPWQWATDLALAAEKAGETCRLDLVPVGALTRLACLYGRGAAKYGDENWRKGINLKRTWRSLMRHSVAWFLGDDSEDHMAGVMWNAVTLMETAVMVREGKLPSDISDAGPGKQS